jgi:hypothetical protein
MAARIGGLVDACNKRGEMIVNREEEDAVELCWMDTLLAVCVARSEGGGDVCRARSSRLL